MKQTALTIFFALLFTCTYSQVTPPVIQWDRCLGGYKEDLGSDVINTSDGGYITAGSSNSANVDVINVHGERDAWIVKFSAQSQIEWRFKYGGSYNDSATAIRELPGGGYIVLGYTISNNGNVTGPLGGGDIWLFKLDMNGVLLWQKCLGGSSADFPGSLELDNNGFIISGQTYSNNGLVSGNHGGGDIWIASLDANANIRWQKCYGGSGEESRGSVKPVSGGGYIFSCETNSSNGDVTPGNPDDIWLVRLDATGNIIWQKTYGGSGFESSGNVTSLADGFVVCGTTSSPESPFTNLGGTDGWIFKTDLLGNILWQYNLGGHYDDVISKISATQDGGFLFAGCSLSFFGDACYSNGEEDFWLGKIDKSGKLQWQKLLGGTKHGLAKSIV